MVINRSFDTLELRLALSSAQDEAAYYAGLADSSVGADRKHWKSRLATKRSLITRLTERIDYLEGNTALPTNN